MAEEATGIGYLAKNQIQHKKLARIGYLVKPVSLVPKIKNCEVLPTYFDLFSMC